jgi:circadian clock protein KaiC
VVIDSLNGYFTAMPEAQFLTLQMHELLGYLAERGVATILTMAQSGLVGGALRSPLDMSFLADTIVLLRYFEDAGRMRKAISVLKKRSGPHEETIREMSLGSGGVHIGAPLENMRGVLTGTPEMILRGEGEASEP